MSQTALPDRNTASSDATGNGKVSLRVVDSNTLPAWTRPQNDPQHNPHCLLYLVALDRPRIHSNQARRLRLKDSLAGSNAGRNAGILARDPHFWDYLQQINLTAYDAEIDTCRARHFINRVCAINSRYELDRNDAAAHRFFSLIEQPFLNWLQTADSD